MDRILALQNLASFTFEEADVPPATRSGQSVGCSTQSSQAFISTCSNVCPPDPKLPEGW